MCIPLIHTSTAYGQQSRGSQLSADMGKIYRESEQLSGEEKVKRAQAHVDEMNKALNQTISKMKDSFDKKAVISTNCIGQVSSTISALSRISNDAMTQLRTASALGQIDKANHYYTKIVLAAERVKRAMPEVMKCDAQVNDTPVDGSKRVKAEVLDELVQAFAPSDSEAEVVTFTPIPTERLDISEGQ